MHVDFYNETYRILIPPCGVSNPSPQPCNIDITKLLSDSRRPRPLILKAHSAARAENSLAGTVCGGHGRGNG
jgi:hypothetical protein